MEQLKKKNKSAKHHKPGRAAANAEVLELQQALQSAQKTNQTQTSIISKLRKQVKELKHKEIDLVLQKGKLVKKIGTMQRIHESNYSPCTKEMARFEEVWKGAGTDETSEEEENETDFENTMDEWEEQMDQELQEMHEERQQPGRGANDKSVHLEDDVGSSKKMHMEQENGIAE